MRTAGYIRGCLHCLDSKAVEIVSRPFGETVHAVRLRQVLYSDYLRTGASGRLVVDGLDERDGFRYALVVMDDVSDFI